MYSDTVQYSQYPSDEQHLHGDHMPGMVNDSLVLYPVLQCNQYSTD